MPFFQLQQLQCMNHGLTFILICVPFLCLLEHVGVDSWVMHQLAFIAEILTIIFCTMLPTFKVCTLIT